LGLLWDRDRWYLVGQREGRKEEPRLWRADRVLSIKIDGQCADDDAFDVETLLNRRWLSKAMAQWVNEAPVVIRLTQRQAQCLQQDWYYRHARFEAVSEHQVVMTFGADNQALVFELLRWLGPGAELLEPKAWRAPLREELRQMAMCYVDSASVVKN
jgi:predicted DNA-binding transcriptional regulator YafY